MNTIDIKNPLAVTNLLDHSYEELFKNIKDYSSILKEYKVSGINKIGIIVGEDFNFNTISLIHALINSGITPYIIDEKLNGEISDIMEEEDIKIVFYESLIKPYYLKGFDIELIKEGHYFVTVKPYISVNNKSKMKSLSWYLKYLNSKSFKEDGVAHLYKKIFDKKEEIIIKEDDLKNFNESLQIITESEVVTSFPLYDKYGFMTLISSLFNDMHLNCIEKGSTTRMINRILKLKPEIVTLDVYTYLSFLGNNKYKNSDLSFIKILMIDDLLKDHDLVFDFLRRHGFKGEIINIEQKNKVIEK